MELKQKGFRIAQAPGRGEVGAITGSPQTPQQSGLGPTLERRIQGQRPATLELLAEGATGEQQGHRNLAYGSGKSGSLWPKRGRGGAGNGVGYLLVLLSVPVR